MVKTRCMWRDVVHNFFSRRLLVFCVFQFSILHYYTDSIKQFAIQVHYPATPWILPFLGLNVYFQFVYGISVIYFYSNIPFMQRHEMYVVMRQGRTGWAFMKILRIWLSAVMLTVLEFILSVLPLFPHLEWTFGWGKLYRTLAVTDTGVISAYQMRLRFPYELINENNALISVLMFLVILCIVTGLTGTVMFFLSICINRTIAILTGTIFAVLTVVFVNLYLYQPWLSFISMFSWMDMRLLYGRVCKNAPSFLMVVLIATILIFVLCSGSLYAIRTKDLKWIDEE